MQATLPESKRAWENWKGSTRKGENAGPPLGDEAELCFCGATGIMKGPLLGLDRRYMNDALP
jgi:hypothetical protein